MQVVFYVSGHGFGHASRDIELIDAIHTKRPDARVIARTTVPEWLFTFADRPIDVQRVETDVGVVQIDSLRLDEEETARRAASFYRDFETRVADEAVLLGRSGADLVLGDIPPLAFAAAAKTGIPSVAIGNFTWDWIYSIYPAFDDLAPDAIGTMRHAYAHATRALRLPLHGGFEPMAAVTRDVPFIARRSTRDPVETRRLLGAGLDQPLVLASFGAYGVRLPLERLRRSDAFTLLLFDRPPHGLKYQDVVAAADVVVSKPGYGIVSECVANDTALLYTSRGRFIEYEVFVAEMPRVLKCRYLPQDELLGGQWADAIEALLAQPDPPERARTDGAEVAAQEILNVVNA